MTALIQDGLSKAQAVPLIGPIVFSPVKVIFSAIEIIAGFGAMSGARKGRSKVEGDAIYLASEGLREMKYAFLNMATIGIAGFIIEFNDVKLILNLFLEEMGSICNKDKTIKDN